MKRGNIIFITCLIIPAWAVVGSGCCGYSNSWLYPEQVKTVYVKMFDTTGFRRDYEYSLTSAVCKRIEAQTPYKIVSDENTADTILTGKVSIYESVIAGERYTGTPLEKEAIVGVTVTWKNLKTGKVLINNEEASVSADYSPQTGQTFDYASEAAVNKAAQRIVELMQKGW